MNLLPSLTLPVIASALLGAAVGSDSTPQRVGGDLEARTVLQDGRYVSGRASAEDLPEGYPAPTAPGAIEIKRYPSVRRAEVSGRMSPDRGMNVGFFPLFRHIQERGIAMTSPVELDLNGWDGDEADGWTMSFLYRTADLGPTGDADGIDVVDTEPVTVLSLGITGPYGMSRVEPGLALLRGWLADQETWIADGDPRALYYNGPDVPDARKWMEVQIPVRRAVTDTASAVGFPDPASTVLDKLAASEATMRASDPTPAEVIELAIQRGAPFFNDHQPEACVAVYEVTAAALLALDTPALDRAVRGELRDALTAMRAEHDAREQAWILRRALETAYSALSTSPGLRASRH